VALGPRPAAQQRAAHLCKQQDAPAEALLPPPLQQLRRGRAGVFPHRPDVDLAALCEALNAVDWGDLGFVCDGRYIFSQRSLENAPLPDSFRQFLPEPAWRTAKGAPDGWCKIKRTNTGRAGPRPPCRRRSPDAQPT
jgi:hypothetical protein